jgi:hypothetical protein
MKIELNPMSALPSDRLRHNDRCGALTKTGQLCQQPEGSGSFKVPPSWWGSGIWGPLWSQKWVL